MREPRWRKRILTIVATIVVVAAVGIGLWNESREEQIAAQLTPETVVQAFEKANYEVLDLREGETVDYESWRAVDGQLPERVLRFRTVGKTQVKPTNVSILMYATSQQAEEVRGGIL